MRKCDCLIPISSCVSLNRRCCHDLNKEYDIRVLDTSFQEKGMENFCYFQLHIPFHEHKVVWISIFMCARLSSFLACLSVWRLRTILGIRYVFVHVST